MPTSPKSSEAVSLIACPGLLRRLLGLGLIFSRVQLDSHEVVKDITQCWVTELEPRAHITQLNSFLRVVSLKSRMYKSGQESVLEVFPCVRVGNVNPGLLFQLP